MTLDHKELNRLAGKLKNISEFGQSVKKIVRYFIVQKILLTIVRFNVTHIFGPAKIEVDPDELVVLCLVRNGELHLKSFIAHYTELGVKHVVFLDNNSTDATRTIASQYNNVTILHTKLAYKRYKLAMKEYLVKRFGKERWTLYVDIDELFDYPYSRAMPLQALLTYLNQNSYNAVVAHMLDMFSDKPLSTINSTIDDSLKDLYQYSDLSDITEMEYFYRNTASKDAKLYFGGIRRILFGPVSGRHGLPLTKHPLIFLDNKILPMFLNDHAVRNAHVADFSCVLFHYKFLGDFYQRTKRIAREENYYNNSSEYKGYLKILDQNPDLQIKQATSQKINSVNDLVDNQFLTVSQDYIDWAKEHSRP